MPWPELQGLLLAHLCHRYTGYESELAAGGDRETLRREIAASALHAYPFLRVDPRPFPADPSLVTLDEAAARLAILTGALHSLLEALSRRRSTKLGSRRA